MPYRAVIKILIGVETETEAIDAVVEAMHSMMQSHNPDSCFLDWYWFREDLIETKPIPENFQPDDKWPNDAK